VGFLICFGYPGKMVWFSLLLGWAIKALMVKFGGTRLLRTAKPLFIGLIVGEAFAAMTWLGITALLASGGYEFFPINILPG